jgi:hypothetical protein
MALIAASLPKETGKPKITAYRGQAVNDIDGLKYAILFVTKIARRKKPDISDVVNDLI